MDEMNEDEVRARPRRRRKTDGFRDRRGDRSMMSGNSLPFGWSVGPWDDQEETWTSRAYSSGDLRPWRAGMPVTGGPVVPEVMTRWTLKGPHITFAGERPDEEEMLRALCWCGQEIVRIPVEWVRECITSHCNRPGCSSQLIQPVAS